MHAGLIRNKQCVKDYMHKEKRQCILNVSFWINLFLTCTNYYFFYSHCRNIGYSFEAGGVTDHLIQSTDDVCEAGSHVAVFLPTVQHQLVQGAGAVHGWWQTVVLLNSINYL